MRKEAHGSVYEESVQWSDLVVMYRRSAMFEYKRTSVRMARKMVEEDKDL